MTTSNEQTCQHRRFWMYIFELCVVYGTEILCCSMYDLLGDAFGLILVAKLLGILVGGGQLGVMVNTLIQNGSLLADV